MMHVFRPAFLLFALTLSLVGSYQAQGAEPETTPARPAESPKPSETPKPTPAGAKPVEFEPPPPVVSEHTMTLPNGKTLKYQAIAGYLLTRGESEKSGRRQPSETTVNPSASPEREPVNPAKGKPKAQVFFVAYLLGNVADPATRPVTFAFNGGPGSSSVWLHMGALGPKRAVLSDNGEALPPPFRVTDNESTWLDHTDLVFIDPVSTGFSRPAPGEESAQFHGYKQDIEAVGDFIRLWTTRYGRWTSPKFVVGESYGTTRAAGLSQYLQERHGLYLNGIVLLSSVLNFQTLAFEAGNDVPYPLFLPSYAAAAWYHQRLTPQLEAQPLSEVLKEAEDFAATDYLVSLAKGDAIASTDRNRVAGELARLTGLDAKYLAQLALREPADRFFIDLLKDQNRSIGRYDSRFTGIRTNPGTHNPDFDPSFEAVHGTYTATFNDYVRRELKYESDLPYEVIADVKPWELARNQYLDVADDLKKAMGANPYLKVLICCGYFDLATPYFAARSIAQKMQLDPAIRSNLQLAYYDSGHMVYIHAASRQKFKNDFEQLLDTALNAHPVNNAEP
jgi:carboxypeptidase C (cathepsin A)